MDDRFRGLMLDAARLTRAGRVHEATLAIRQALGAASPDASRPPADAGGVVLDGLVTERDAARPRPLAPPGDARTRVPPPVSDPRSRDADDGRFVAGRHEHGSTGRDYRLYVPPGADGRTLPLVVMLHGCTQDAADFAAGTGMNRWARERGLFVLYPEQSARANPQRCWNWFKHTHQRPHRGEPGLIASMTQAVVRRHGIDPDRVWIAGLSAGGAMAAIVASCHPDTFAAVGVHSGLAPGAAVDLQQALAAMRGGPGPASGPRRAIPVPTIVFHGDRDPTVHPRNGERTIEAVIRGAGPDAAVREEHGTSTGGRRFTRRVHAGDGAHPDAEHWIVHGAGHAWSGGSPAGSHTDPAGPDATAEMLRFFVEHPRTRGAR